jgi:hypothetical protein
MKISRRNFINIFGVGSLAVVGNSLSGEIFPKTSEEPKSIHTWLDSDKTQIYNYDIDIKINDFPVNADRKWLYYQSLQVNFTGHEEWSHGGFQWSGTKEFRDSGNLGVNWGGGSDWAGYGGIGVTNTPFKWKKKNWYRYRVWRLKKENDGLWRWLFAVLDYRTGKDLQYGTVKTKSPWIKNAVVFTETGYGVRCNTSKINVEWRNPVFRTPQGIFKPTKGVATYNGTCQGPNNTQQGMISTSPLHWFHSTNSRRTSAYNTRLW